MIEPATIFGISMARRQNRRVLVCVTYGAFTAVSIAVATIPLLRPTRLNVLSTAVPFFAVAWSFVAYYLFGRIASPFLVAPWWQRSPERVDRGFGLSASVPLETPRPDERDLAIRNSAYYYAYQAFLALCLAGVVAFGIGQRLGRTAQESVNFCVIMLLLVTAPTLPQAVVLWRENDIAADL